MNRIYKRMRGAVQNLYRYNETGLQPAARLILLPRKDAYEIFQDPDNGEDNAIAEIDRMTSTGLWLTAKVSV